MSGINFPVGVTRTIARLGLKLKQYAPEILMGVGVVAVVGVAVTAIRATLKVEEVLDHHEEQIKLLDESELEDEEERLKEKVRIFMKTGGELFVLYLPVLTFGVLSVASFMGAHKILKSRNTALLAAYKVLEYSYNEYRDRVREDHGDDYDRDISRSAAYKGAVKSTEIVKNEETGEEETIIEKYGDPNLPSVYAFWFDEMSPAWERDASYNMLFLQQQQLYWNDKLWADGHVFLNQVRHSLGLPATRVGSITGWVLDPTDPNTDDRVDFGIFNINDDRSRAFVNGHEASVLIDPNVQGVIWNLI